jgi:hypothetical protein
MVNDKVNIMKYAGLATQLLVMMGLGVWGGHKLDIYIGWKYPLFLLLFPLLALVVSLYQLIKEFSKKK